MRRATENHENTRTRSEYFSPRSKVMDHTLQECSLPNFASFLQETPMKPSQVPNQLPHPPPRRMLPLQSPELCHRDRLGPPRHPPQHHLGPIPPSRFAPSNPADVGQPLNGPPLVPRHRLSPMHHPAQPPWPVPISPTNSGTTADRPQPSSPSVFHHGSPQFMKDSSDRCSSYHIRTDHMTESSASLSHSGSKNITAQRQESNQAQSNDVRSPTQTVQLHRPPTTPALNTRAPQDACPLPRSGSEHRSPGNSQWPLSAYQPSPSTQFLDRSSGSSLPITHSPVTPRQDQLHKEACSSEKSIPVDLNHSSQSQKWRREIEDYDGSAKKLCLQGANSGKAQTPKPTVGSSLSTSLASQPSSGQSPALELSPKTTDNHLCKEAACGQSTCSELSSTFKPIQSSCASLSPKPCIKKRPPMGAKQAYINSFQSQLIELSSPTKACEESFKSNEENCRRDKSNLLFSSKLPQKDTGSSSGSHHSHVQRSISLISTKGPSRGDQLERRKSDTSTLKPASKPNSASVSGRTAERPKTARPRRPVAVPDDLGDLFTPDPLTYVVNPGHKAAKPKVDGGTTKAPTSDRSCSSSTVSGSITAVAGSSCPKAQDPTATGSPQICLPTVALERVKLENLKSFSPKDSDLKNSPVTSSSRQLKPERVKSEEKHTSPFPNNARPRSLKTETAAPEHTSTSHCSRSPPLGRQASEGGRKPVNLEDPIDVDLEFSESMYFTSQMDLTQSSHSSEEEEELISLQEMMTRVKRPPDTPEKGAFSEPSTPGHDGSQPKTQPLPTTTKANIYKNSLDQMLKEINSNKRAKEIETQLLTACKEDLLRIAEYEEAKENREEAISTEHQQFLQRYSLMSIAIREVPPGEEVFNLEKFGQLFNQDTLQLRQCMVTPQGTAQKTLLWSSPAQLRLHVNIGLFQEAYSRSPCPTQVTRFLFKMMSVHNERMLSEKILQALCDIACTAAYQRVKNGSQQFKVWVPSLADVVLVLMNMGVAFVTLFPFENLQPPFTEGALLEDIYIKNESPSSNKEQSTFPEHNCNNILKYLSYCMGLCPRAYSDSELLLLLTVVGRVGLDSRLILQSGVELYPLQYKILNNFRDWDTMLPRICLALTDMTDDHHNMCLLVQLLPDNTRGKQLRRHLSLSMISKLLDGNCTYRPTEKEIQLSELRPYLPRMQPSTLFRGMMRSCNRNQKDKEDTATLDQQSYYLCYSLLTLANEASNFQFFPARQKAQLLLLCSELETYVKCDIRESEKCLYRSKVKDLVARISTKWQMLLQRTRPLDGKLYDYWQPVLADTLTSSQEEQEEDNDGDGEGSVMEVDEDEEGGVETSGTEENEVLMIAEDEEKEEGADSMDDSKETADDTKPEEMEADDATGDRKETGDDTKLQEVAGDGATDGANETEEMTESVQGVLNQDMSEMEPQVNKESEVMDEQIDSGNIERTEVQTETLVETRETSQPDQVAA